MAIKNSKPIDLKKQEKKILLGFILIIAIYSLATLLFDLRKILNLALSFNWKILPLLILLSFLNYLFRGLRFHFLLKKIDIKLPLTTSFKIFFSGISMTLTPGKSGEVIKAYLIKKFTGNKFAETVPLVVFERLTDGVAMIILGLTGFYFFNNFVMVLLFSALAPIAFYLAIKQRSFFLKLFVKPLEKRFPKLKIFESAIHFFDNSEKLFKPKTFGLALLLALVAWSLEGASLFLLLSQFAPASLKLLFLSLFTFSFSSIAGFFALVPGGVGVAEGSIVYLVKTFVNLSLTESIFATLLFRTTTLLFGVILGTTTLVKTMKNI